MRFSSKTFAYFDGAKKNQHDRGWFESNRELYTDAVEVPFEHLVHLLHLRLAPSLPGISFSARKITKPVARAGKDASGPAHRLKTTASFSEKTTSMFESNPGFYVSLGADAEDNVIGCGLYMPSARQFRELRPRLALDPPELREILDEQALKAHWAGLSSEHFTRFPRGFDDAAPGAHYLRHRNWLLSKTLTRKAVAGPSFIEDTVEAFAAALPFLAWTRTAVGVYRKAKAGEELVD